MVLLHHYTDRAGKDGIYSDKLVRATDAGDGLGKVVRFTELPPNSAPATLVANNWGTLAPPPRARDKLRYWFKFDSDDLPAGTKQVTTVGARNIWICPVDVPLKNNARDTSRKTPTRRRTFRAPTPPPLQSDAQRTILYHYTDRAGKDAIHKDGFIKAVRPHGGQGLGANMPIAVYFTEIIPTAPKDDLIFNMYGSRDIVKHSDWLERTKFWFKFDAKDVPGVYKRPTAKGRNEWVCERNVPINSSTLLARGKRR